MLELLYRKKFPFHIKKFRGNSNAKMKLKIFQSFECFFLIIVFSLVTDHCKYPIIL